MRAMTTREELLKLGTRQDGWTFPGRPCLLMWDDPAHSRTGVVWICHTSHPAQIVKIRNCSKMETEQSAHGMLAIKKSLTMEEVMEYLTNADKFIV